MNLKGCSNDDLNRTKNELDAFLGDKAMLGKVRDYLSDSSISEEQRKVLSIFERTFQCYIIEDNSAVELKERIGKLEGDLARERNLMNLGYISPETNTFVSASSVQLRNTMRTSDSYETRKACYDGLRSIGPFVAERFVEIVKLRNVFARSLGYECFYDMKVSQAEGFNKQALFSILDDLEVKTRPIMHSALEKLRQEKGVDALLPENIGYALAGDVSKLKDPYFPFENAVDAWARSFSALGFHIIFESKY
jgi:Zn-dependent oligopeptidase